LIVVSDLIHQYRTPQGVTDALKGVNLTIDQGEFLAIIGHNGSGKSTLAKHLNALLLPDAGTVTVDGLDTRKKEQLWDIRQKVGMVFQNPDNQLIATTVEEDVAFGPENLGLSSEDIRKRVDTALTLVSMEDYKKYPPDFLSGGQKQKVCIAGLLAMQPQYMILDEPGSMLDSKGCKELMLTLSALHKDQTISIVLITHRLEEAIYADRIVLIDEGQIIMDGATPDIIIQYDCLLKLGIEPMEISTIIHHLNESGKHNYDTSIYKTDDLVNAICR
jgi:energy-coupling factor transport system ATP-binding protein